MRVLVNSILLAGSLAFFVVSRPTYVPQFRALHTSVDIEPSDEREVERIRAHFDRVLVELAARDISELTPDQRTRRAELVATLRQYRNDGAYPRNYDFPDRRVPYFVDRKTGVRCAMAHLIESTGRQDIVERVRATNNNVLVPQLAGDTAFTAWLDMSGLTIAEAARIQPTYGGTGVSTREDQSYQFTSAIAIGGSLFSALWNASVNRNGENRAMSTIGVVIGAATIGLGAFSEAFPNPSAGLVIGNAVAGTTSVFFSTRGLVRRNRVAKTPTGTANSSTASPRRGVETMVAPAFSLVGQKTAGVALNLRF